MTADNALKLQQSRNEFAHPGYWKLEPDRALTLAPAQAGVLRVAHGQVWATLDGPHHGPANDWGDVVLCSGEQLLLTPGQHVVVEPFGDAVNEPAYFSWEPADSVAKADAGTPGWRDASIGALDAPDDEIWVSLRPVARLLARVGEWLMYLVPGRGRVLSWYESNQP